MANGDEYVAIQKLTMAGVPIYLPEGQEFFRHHRNAGARWAG